MTRPPFALILEAHERPKIDKLRSRGLPLRKLTLDSLVDSFFLNVRVPGTSKTVEFLRGSDKFAGPLGRKAC